jgi:hypothetical protein
MLALVGARFGVIFGVMLNRAEWPGAAVVSSQTRIGKTKISWYAPAERHEAVLLCEQSRRLTLLVLPPDTPEQIALTAALMACAPGNALTTNETLARARLEAQPPLSDTGPNAPSAPRPDGHQPTTGGST